MTHKLDLYVNIAYIAFTIGKIFNLKATRSMTFQDILSSLKKIIELGNFYIFKDLKVKPIGKLGNK